MVGDILPQNIGMKIVKEPNQSRPTRRERRNSDPSQVKVKRELQSPDLDLDKSGDNVSYRNPQKIFAFVINHS